ncbi:hypothetical protein FBUS_01685 [Fasciolopsis buskii]|uniref:Uncharacterized protein n=1 Tax=Fasciolopsis buskii TaxID=27845 RepID=A0A8E0RUZ7_9TREM|nr:hypothetical protein FBUS_01685 [Fasciolopsis buski]
MRLRTQQKQQSHNDLYHQSLANRRSKWVVNPTQLMSSDQSATVRPHTATNVRTNCQMALSRHCLQHFGLSGCLDPDNPGSPSSVLETSIIAGPVHFGSSSPHLYLIKALNQLCMHSTTDLVSTCSENSYNGSSLPNCLPGFEHQPDLCSQCLPVSKQQSHQTSVSAMDSLYSACSVKPTDPYCFASSTVSVIGTDTHHPNDVWAATICDATASNTQFLLNAQVTEATTASLSTMHALNPTDYLSPSRFVKNSLLLRLFPLASTRLERILSVGEGAASAKTARLNAICSQTAHDPINSRTSTLSSGMICCDTLDDEGDDDDLAGAFPYLAASGPSDVGETVLPMSSFTPYFGHGMFVTSDSNKENPIATTRCCVAIGDGRRCCPSTRMSSPTQVVDQMSGVSVTSSMIASMTGCPRR